MLSGWAINDNAPIGSVALSIDGSSYRNASYGVSRPDVCAVYPGRAGCPNVGWVSSIDTTQLSDGTHTLAIEVVASSGEHLAASTTFTVSNWSTVNPMKINIDRPNAQSGPFSGVAAWGGWAVDDLSAITNVAIAVDSVPFGNALYGGNRTDVRYVFPGRPGCPNVGWNISLDTTSLSDGTHTLDVIATSVGGQHTTATASFQVSNLAGANPMRISIDRPNAQTAPLSGFAAIGGWAINESVAISSVAVLVDRALVGAAIYGGIRPDVCAVYPSVPGCPNVGWSFLFDTTAFSNGSHTLEVVVSTANGQPGIESASITISN